MRQRVYLIAGLFLPALAFAQDPKGGPPNTPEAIASWLPGAGYFFAALIAGVILAVAFQLILTNLSVAAGLNVLGTVTEADPRKRNAKKDKNDEDEPASETVQKINSAFGAWALITASIALFAASWLAGSLTLTHSAAIGAILGLTIWGLFYVTTMTVEVNAVSSLVGMLGRMAAAGLRTAAGAVSSVFSRSEETKAADTAAKVVSAVKEELFGDLDVKDVRKELERLVDRLAPQKIDPARIRQELAKLLDETEIRAIAQSDGSFLDNQMIVAHLKNRGMDEQGGKAIAGGIQDAFAKIREEARSNKDTASKVTDAAMRVAGLSPDEARAQREKLENWLRSTGKEELNPEGIKRDIERLFSNRKEGIEALKSRFAGIDRDTVVAVLAQRSDMTKEEAQHIVDQVQRVLNQVTDGAADVKTGIISKVRNYLNSLDRPELEYEGVERDFRKLFSDPKEGADALLRRLKSVDRDTIKAILASRDGVSAEDAERIISRVEGMRDSLVSKAEQMKDEVARRLERAKHETIRQADQVRAVAATAAWWAFGTAVVSGAAAAIGGVLASGGF